MTQHFILDENIIILAHRGENDNGAKDTTCLELFTGIIRICHTLVADDQLFSKYMIQLHRHRAKEPQPVPGVVTLLVQLRTREDKLDIRTRNAPPFSEEEAIPAGSRKDIYIVRLAVATRAILVTRDEKLILHLGRSGITEKYELRLLSPIAALAEL